MDFLPFPLGTTAKGTADGRAIIAAQFLNKKGQPILNVLKGQTELAQVLMGTEFVNKGICRCLRAYNPEYEFSWSIGKNLKRCAKADFLDESDFTALAAVRDIRNIIAHADFTIVLSDDEVKPDIHKLTEWLGGVERKCLAQSAGGQWIPGWQSTLMKMEEWRPENVCRSAFLGAIIMLYTGLANVQWALDPSSYTGEVVG